MESLSRLWQTFQAHLAADRRKTAALVLLTVVLLVVWGRVFLSDDGPVSTEVPIQLAGTMLAPQPADADSPAVTVAASAADFDLPVAVDVRPVPGAPTRDFFAGELDPVAPATQPAAASGVGIFERLRATVRKTREERQRRCALIEAEASKLILQSTLIGDQELAVVSGRKLVIGAEVDGFRLVSVRDRSAVLEKDGHRVTLSMP